MRRESAICYISEPQGGDILENALKVMDFNFEIINGGFETLIRDAAGWAILPDYIVVDISDMTDIEPMLQEFVAASPEGETEMIFIGNNTDIGFYRHLRHLGALDYFCRPLKEEDVAATIRQAAEKNRARRGEIARDKLIAVTHASPGAGASVVAHALAFHLAQKGKETFLIDLDIVRGIQYLLAGAAETSGLIDILASPNRLDKLFLERTRVTPAPHLSLLSTVIAPDQKRPETDDGINMLLSSIREAVDFAVVDVPLGSVVGSNTIAQAGRLVIVAEPTIFDLRGVNQVIIENTLSPNQEIVLVLNKTGAIKEGAIGAKDFLERFDLPMVEIAFDPKNMYKALMQGEPMQKQGGPIVSAMANLVGKLNIQEPDVGATSILDTIKKFVGV